MPKSDKDAHVEVASERGDFVATSAPVMLHVTDADGRLVQVSDIWLETLGYAREDVIGRASDEFLTDQSRDYFQQHCLPVFQRSGRLNDEPLQLCTRRGDIVDVLLSSTLERDASGTPVRAITVAVDVTEQKLAERSLRSSEQRYRLLAEHATDMISRHTLDGEYLFATPASKLLLGFMPEELYGRNVYEFVSEEDLPNLRAAHNAVLGGEATVTVSYRARRHDGAITWLETTTRAVRDPKTNEAVEITAVSRDINERKQAEDKLRQADMVFKHTTEGIIIADADARITAINPAFTQITGFTEPELLGKPLSALQSTRVDHDTSEAISHAVRLHGQWQGELWCRRENNQEFPSWTSINLVHDSRGMISHHVMVCADISVLKEANERLQYLAQHDALTDLPNRLLLSDRLGQALARARRDRLGVAVCFLDLDRFKTVNDSLGHPAGDQVLGAVARRLLASVRAEDTVARIGGDEYVVLLEQVSDARQAGAVAQKLLRSLSVPLRIAEHEIYFTASVGISLYPDDGADVETLIRNADAAMYRAKDGGGNRYHFYTEELTGAAHDRLMMEAALRRALEKREFLLHYQPQVVLETGEVRGVEALLRWQHPERGLLYPESFLALAEETGLILPIGGWVINAACRQLRHWQTDGLNPPRMAVNISVKQIEQEGFVDEVRSAIAQHQVDPALLELEVTESVFLTQTERMLATIDELRALGISLAIDDFGAGYSSLGYLKRLPIHKLKIDRVFVQDLPHDANDMAIADAIIGLSDSLELGVVAEGVETQAQADFLREHQCAEAQGFLFGRPVDADAFSAAYLHRLS